MVFGEIVEPSTRALIDDEFEEYPEYEQPEFSWEGCFKVPPNVDTIIFCESSKIIKLFEALALNKDTILCSSKKGGIHIYKAEKDKYIITYVSSEVTTGQIVEVIMDWIKKASHIYAITSEPIATYQHINLSEKPETLIRKLSTDNSSIFNCPKLESPNLVSGLGADVLSFCIHLDLKANLYVVYMDNSPLDSININPVIQLMTSLGLPLRTPQNLNAPPSNLYL